MRMQTYMTGRPTGVKRFQSDFTPMMSKFNQPLDRELGCMIVNIERKDVVKAIVLITRLTSQRVADPTESNSDSS
jgi:hypothetical protein